MGYQIRGKKKGGGGGGGAKNGTKEHGLVMGISRTGEWLDLMILKVFSNLD